MRGKGYVGGLERAEIRFKL